MTTTIKITELTNIGANLASSTVIPVVNMGGTPTTEKAVLGNVANFILAGAGGNYVAAAVATTATTANTVLTNAQPNITSVGTLTSLTITGNITSGNANLGNAVTANYFIGAGNNLSNISGANVSGNVANATYAVSAGTAGTVTTNAQPNITSIGSLTGLTVSNATGIINFSNTANVTLGNVSNLHIIGGSNGQALTTNGSGNLTWTTIAGGANTGNISFNNNIIYSNSGVVVNNSDLGNGQTAGMSIPVQGDGNAVALYNTYGNVNLLAGNIGNSQSVQTWSFGASGNLTLPANTFAINYANGTQVSLGGGIQSSIANGNSNVSIASSSGNIAINSAGNTWAFDTNGTTIFPTLTIPRGDEQSTITGQTLLFGDATQEAIISTPNGSNASGINSQRLVINPGKGEDSNGGEGGDIYLWAGRGGNNNGSGGDVKIRGGYAPADGTGGYIRMDGGASQANGAPGFIEITGGQGGNTTGGYVEITGGQGATVGGDVKMYGGYGTATGGNVNIWGGASGNGQINEGHVNIQTGGNTWTFDPSGNLSVPGDLLGPANVDFTIYANAGVHEFVFAQDGTFYAPDTVVLGGNTIYIGPGANTLAGLEHAVMIASSNHNAYIQAVINNVSDNGSADWVAQGRLGDDTGGWADMGFTSGGFNDPNFTITGPGDGYLLVESYAPGQLITGPKGGNLILATGEQGTVRDIIFGTGGFLTGNIFGRMSDANNSFELSRAGATIKFPDSTVQNTAWTGNVARIANGNSNVNIATSNGNVTINSAGNTWRFDNTGNLTLPANAFAINYSNGTQVSIPTVGNIATINLDGSSSNVLYGNGVFAVVAAPTVAQDITSNGAMSIMTYDGNLKYVNYATVEPSTGNIAGGNLSTSGTLSVTGNITGGNITTAGVLKISGALAYIDVAGTGFIQNGGTGEFQLSTANATQPLKISTNSASKNWFFYANGDMTAPGNISAGNMSATLFTGALTGLASSATVAASANAVAGANVSGQVGNALVAGTVYTNAQPNITSVGTLTSISVSGNANVGNLGTGRVIATGNISGTQLISNIATGTAPLVVTSTTRVANLSVDYANVADFITVAAGTGNNFLVFANAATGNVSEVTSTGITANLSTNAITATTFVGALANGNSNVNIATANGNVTITAVGNTTMTVTGTGANITGNLNVTGNITGNTNGFAIGYLNIPQIAAANATLALTDAGKHYYSTSAGNFTLTIPTNATVAFASGTAISIVVQSAGNVLVNAASGVTLYMAGNSTAANRVVSNYGMATIMKVATDTWMINGTGVA
jgi:hypothetical protein